MMEKRHRRYPERSDVSIIGVLEGGRENRAETIFEDLMTGPVSLRKDKEICTFKYHGETCDFLPSKWNRVV